MAEYSEAFLKKTIEVWQPYSQQLLSPEDAGEIASNVVELFKFLQVLDQKYSVQKPN